jgi:hypothetical protein
MFASLNGLNGGSIQMFLLLLYVMLCYICYYSARLLVSSFVLTILYQYIELSSLVERQQFIMAFPAELMAVRLCSLSSTSIVIYGTQ